MSALKLALLSIAALLLAADAHRHEQVTVASDAFLDLSEEPWTSKYGAQEDLGYSGPLSFSHLPYARCLEDATKPFDIGILGFPFDTTTSYRPGEWYNTLIELCIDHTMLRCSVRSVCYPLG